MENKTDWCRGFTAKRYLHPPFAERIITMWPNAKIAVGTISAEEERPIAHGFRVLFGELPTGLSRSEVRYHTREDGIPVHTIEHRVNNYNFTLESFCDIQRSPTVFSRITVHNPCGRTIKGRLTVMMRSGDERLITGSDDDGYSPYVDDNGPWWAMPCDAECDGRRMQEQGCRLCFSGAVFTPAGKGLISLDYTLDAGQSLVFDLSFGEKAPETFDYEALKSETVQFWENELSAIHNRPHTGDWEVQAIYTNFIAQILQLFCIPQDRNYVLPRQGSMQRLIWPVEAMPMLEALTKAGDFSKYLRAALDTYFGVMQIQDGQDAGMISNFGIPWAGVTGACLYTFGVYTLISGDRETFEKHRQAALDALRWIERTRAVSTADPELVDGLFPPMRSCDYEVPSAQSWGITDLVNLDGYRRLQQAFDHFDGEGKEEVTAACEGYRRDLKNAVDAVIERYGQAAFFTMPVDPKDDPVREEFFKKSVAPRRETVTPTFLNLGLIDETADIPARLEAGCRELGVMNRGLTWRLQDLGVFKDGRLTWYGSFVDREWFLYYMRSGQRQKAKQVLEAQLQYMMTPEYYMMERYDDANPYYTPWLPNGSANGRTLLMLLEWYGQNNL